MPELIECAHAECACMVPSGMQHCSEYCRTAEEETRAQERRDPGQLFATGLRCDCGHAECEGRVNRGAAPHEQAR